MALTCVIIFSIACFSVCFRVSVCHIKQLDVTSSCVEVFIDRGFISVPERYIPKQLTIYGFHLVFMTCREINGRKHHT